jgi:hypothetical protein
LPGVWLDRIARDKDFLIIEGKAVSKKGDELIFVNQFNENLKSNAIFMKGVKSIEISSAEHKKEKTLELGVFTLTGILNVESHE